MTAAVRVDIAGAQMGGAARGRTAMHAKRSVRGANASENRDPADLSYFDHLRPTMTRERIEP